MGSSNDEEKEDKPKKAFLLKITVWTDGEVDTDIRKYEKIGTGRGAPTLCGPLNPDEFNQSLKNVLISHQAVCKAISTDIGLEKEASKSKDAKFDSTEVEKELLKVKKPVAIEDKKIPENLDFNIDGK